MDAMLKKYISNIIVVVLASTICKAKKYVQCLNYQKVVASYFSLLKNSNHMCTNIQIVFLSLLPKCKK